MWSRYLYDSLDILPPPEMKFARPVQNVITKWFCFRDDIAPSQLYMILSLFNRDTLPTHK